MYTDAPGANVPQDAVILVLTILISSILIYNSHNAPHKKNLERLEYGVFFAFHKMPRSRLYCHKAIRWREVQLSENFVVSSVCILATNLHGCFIKVKFLFICIRYLYIFLNPSCLIVVVYLHILCHPMESLNYNQHITRVVLPMDKLHNRINLDLCRQVFHNI